MGVFSFFSPCAFPLVPGYLGYLMGGRGEASLTRSAAIGLACLTGILISTATLGVVASALRGLFAEALPWIKTGSAIAILILGAVYLAPLKLSLPVLFKRPMGGRGLLGALGYGLFFGPVVFSCSFPLVASIFLYSLTLLDALASFLSFLAYGLGLGLPLVVLSVATSKLRSLFVRKAGEHYWWIRLGGGVLLLAAGIFILLEAWT